MHGSEKLGPFSLEILQAYIDNGTISPDDYVWTEDIDGWQRISELADSPQPCDGKGYLKAEQRQSNHWWKKSWFSMNAGQLTVLWYVAITACILLVFPEDLFHMSFNANETLGMYIIAVLVIGSTLLFTLREHTAAILKHLWFTVAMPICVIVLAIFLAGVIFSFFSQQKKESTRVHLSSLNKIILYNIELHGSWNKPTNQTIDGISGRVLNPLSRPIREITLLFKALNTDGLVIEHREIPLWNLVVNADSSTTFDCNFSIKNLPEKITYHVEVINAFFSSDTKENTQIRAWLTQIDTARKQGLPDDEIFEHLAKKYPRFQEAKEAGYSLSELYKNLGEQVGLGEAKRQAAQLNPFSIQAGHF